VSDLPREELLNRANIILNSFHEFGIKADVYFKFTCEKCGERVAFKQPNILFENGECFKCGHTTVVTKGGFMLQADV
jgi:rRNA maturation endonuclease Nob1